MYSIHLVFRRKQLLLCTLGKRNIFIFLVCGNVPFGKISKEENLFMRWVNDALKKMFGCHIGKNGKSKRAKWHLLFSAPWNHNGKILETKVKVSEKTKIAVVWKI